MSTYGNDRHEGDNNWNNYTLPFIKEQKEIVKLFRDNIDYKSATPDEDNNHSVDGFINGIPIQIRNQTSNKLHPKQMFPTMRCQRPQSVSEEQQESEYYKIKNNRLKGHLYPKYLIWCLLEKETKQIIKLQIVGMDFFYEFKHCIGTFGDNNKMVIRSATPWSVKDIDHRYNKDRSTWKDNNILYLNCIPNNESTSGNSNFLVLNSNINDEGFCIYSYKNYK